MAQRRDAAGRFVSNRTLIEKKVLAEAEASMTLACQGMIDEMHRLFALPKSGELMSPTSSLRRSAPGEPPAVETARLKNSLTYKVERQGNAIVGHVGTNAKHRGFHYPIHLELKLDRVFMKPAFDLGVRFLTGRYAKIMKVRKTL